MIPGNFIYQRPSTKAEALQMLADGGEDALPLAGGHSLIPMMKLRLAEPSTLVDLAKIAELNVINIDTSMISIGALVTQHQLINASDLSQACPILKEAAQQIADPQIRYCGTLGGNVGNGDPGNDMPGVMQCLNATYTLENVSGSRQITARDYYQGAYFTALVPGEIITHITIPKPAEGHGYAYIKLKRKVGDYATAAAAVMLEISGGKVGGASIALTNVGDTPLFAAEAVERLVGTELMPTDVDAAVKAAEAITNPASDGRGSAEYRTKMAGVMVRRAILKAKERAGEVKGGGLLSWLKG
jgi:aerobic carbon-monoxide dehydrogenase medium subunit